MQEVCYICDERAIYKVNGGESINAKRKLLPTWFGGIKGKCGITRATRE